MKLFTTLIAAAFLATSALAADVPAPSAAKKGVKTAAMADSAKPLKAKKAHKKAKKSHKKAKKAAAAK